MILRSTGTCGVQEICGLIGYSAEQSMLQFCASLFNPGPKSRYTSDSNIYNHHGGIPFCFYLFTAGYQPKGRGYGREFATLIKKNKLGIVVQAPEVKNDLYHPDHSNQAWLWSPDATALKKWFNAQKKAGKAPGEPDEDDGY